VRAAFLCSPECTSLLACLSSPLVLAAQAQAVHLCLQPKCRQGACLSCRPARAKQVRAACLPALAVQGARQSALAWPSGQASGPLRQASERPSHDLTTKKLVPMRTSFKFNRRLRRGPLSKMPRSGAASCWLHSHQVGSIPRCLELVHLRFLASIEGFARDPNEHCD
jgi:hypothetical protein